MKWKVELNNLALGGFAPGYYKETYPSYGNKNQAGKMQNVDLTSPSFITQGPAFATLTNGTELLALTTEIKSILDFAVSASFTYGVGGNLLYKISDSAITDDATWPHTIDKAAVTSETGQDVAYYKGNIYYSYTHSGSSGDIGIYNLDATFDDDWASTVPTGAAAVANAGQMVVGDNDVLYIANGRYVTSYDGTTLIIQALDLPTDARIQSIAWMNDKLWIATAREPFSGGLISTTKTDSSIFVWDGTSDSWEAEIPVAGLIGGLHVKNGTLFLFHADVSDWPITYVSCKLAHVSGTTIVDLATFDGNLPYYGQITDFKDFLLFEANNLLYAYGAGLKDLPVRFFQYAGSPYSGIPADAKALACPFGELILYSSNNFLEEKRLSVARRSSTTYTTSGHWKSLMFDITPGGRIPKIDYVRINFEVLSSGQRVDWKLLNNKGQTIYSDIISFSKLGAATTAYYPLNGKVAENFRLEFDFANSSSTVPIKIKNASIYGTTE